MNRDVTTGALLIAGAVVVNVAFTLLGSTFDYPDVLQQPAADVLARFHDNAMAVSASSRCWRWAPPSSPP